MQLKMVEKTKLKNGKSFYDWCYENLSKEEADKIMERWDYDLNINKYGEQLSPKDISYGSMGFDKKGYWFKCLDYSEHKSELKNTKGFTRGQNGSLNCDQCNTIIITHPHLIKYLINKKDGYKYSTGSNEKIPMKCPDCGYKKLISPNVLNRQGFSCNRCSDGKSFCEKFMFSFLEQLLNNNFQTQLTKITFSWCDKYKYDFYVDNINCIIETHGLQHYKEGFNRIKTSKKHIKTLKEVQENDIMKERLANINNIKNYIILDCRYSTSEYIKKSIMESVLPKLLNFKENDIDWNKCNEFAFNSLVKKASELWNNGIKSTFQIGKILKMHKTTIIRYLKQGAKIGWCDYDSSTALLNKKYNYKIVICLNTGEIFNSIVEASKKYNTTTISQYCNGKTKYAGKHPATNENLKWMYYDEYIKLQNNNLLII